MKIIISNSSEEPIYAQIVNQIKEQIVKGELADGEPLPSIRSLARELNISVITTKRAYDELERDGFIETVAGKGSFVSSLNREMLREGQIRMIEEKLADAIGTAKRLGLSLQELQDMLTLIYEGDEHG